MKNEGVRSPTSGTEYRSTSGLRWNTSAFVRSCVLPYEVAEASVDLIAGQHCRDKPERQGLDPCSAGMPKTQHPDGRLPLF